MNIQLIRSATLRVTYGGHLFLVDPFLAPKGSLRPFAGIAKNPTVDLPLPPEEVIRDVEMVLVSHLHSDHFDDVAVELLPKTLPIFCQPGDEAPIREKGFEHVTAVSHQITWQGITISRTLGQHGYGQLAVRMGYVAGFVWQAAGEPTIYWAGDTIWYDAVADTIAHYQPDIIITHSCGAKFGNSKPIVMDAAQTVAVCQAAPSAVVVAVHLDSLDHGTVSRADLRAEAVANQITEQQLRIPADGEVVEFRS